MRLMIFFQKTQCIYPLMPIHDVCTLKNCTVWFVNLWSLEKRGGGEKKQILPSVSNWNFKWSPADRLLHSFSGSCVMSASSINCDSLDVQTFFFLFFFSCFFFFFPPPPSKVSKQHKSLKSRDLLHDSDPWPPGERDSLWKKIDMFVNNEIMRWQP